MSRLDIIRAWKDAAYRQSLSKAQLAAMPANPAGLVDLTAEEAAAIAGRANGADTSCGPKCTTNPIKPL
jgi:mersacidin/lichenicidin family type 2 lantibiotic